MLPTHGVLISYTVQRYQPPALFRIDDWKPYAIGLVDIGDGLEVMGMLSGFALDAIAIGSRVRLVVEPLYIDAARGPVLTYKFAPETET
ncbi:Zn-ribbon domain-containing OB-fold protein [Sphingomonas psychrolutea]|nr:OB-fold domain-containing protein [Sphingomonas psychrolutea]